MQRCGSLRHIFGSPTLALTLKLRLYVASVCSLLTYGCESWTLDEPTTRRINGANSRMLAQITRRAIRDEARPQTTSHNLILQIRKLRLRYLGHILRAGPTHLTYQAIQVQWSMKKKGNLFMDAPSANSVKDMTLTAKDEPKWTNLIRLLH